uniref:complement C1q subcomponent subunit A-like n=1 Tax=Scatophagus argus TaxID=75038 RepID=UPI001ED846DD|nr:complement C1q subcomponent subunit A-like [Scatophagus argus]
MGGYHRLEVLVGVALFLTTGQCDVGCGGTDGRPGEAGIPGRDGRAGVKGEKGEPAVVASGPVDTAAMLRLKGETGNRGKHGDMGPKGYRGEIGKPGLPGMPGRPGPDGQSTDQGQQSLQQAHRAFSGTRTDSSYPRFGKVVTYQNAGVNTHGDFSAATGYFTCKKAGVYYFTFTSVAKVSMCLSIVNGATNNRLGFCDYNRNTDQVLTGGVVLELTVGQKVWLESFRDQQRDSETHDTNEKLITFSGFLLF